MKDISLQDLRPSQAKFTLGATGSKAYILRPVSLEDELWMRERYGDEIQAIFSEVRIKDLCAIAFHQLIDSQKLDFEEQTVTLVNEKGQRVSATRGGEDLFRTLVIGLADKQAVYEALAVTIGISRRTIESLRFHGEEKKSPENQPRKSTGQKSSTRSARSTGGRRTKS